MTPEMDIGGHGWTGAVQLLIRRSWVRIPAPHHSRLALLRQISPTVTTVISSQMGFVLQK